MAADDDGPSKGPTTYREEAALYLNWVRVRWEGAKVSWRESPQWSKMIASLYLSMYIAMYIVFSASMTYENYIRYYATEHYRGLVPFGYWISSPFLLAPFALVMWIVMAPAVPFRRYIVSWRFPFLRWGYALVAIYAALFSMMFALLGINDIHWNVLRRCILHGQAIALIATVAFALIAPRLGVTLDEAA